MQQDRIFLAQGDTASQPGRQAAADGLRDRVLMFDHGQNIAGIGCKLKMDFVH